MLATFVLLFLMTGSLLVPVKTLSSTRSRLARRLASCPGSSSTGTSQGPLQFTTTGGIETYVLVMIIAFGFGLAMDYEVFLLARIKEHVDAGRTQRRGRAQGPAAVRTHHHLGRRRDLLVFVGFATGQVLVIKEVGIGLAVAVFLDATLVRMLLVPATMTLLGDWNWWAPAPLRRLYAPSPHRSLAWSSLLPVKRAPRQPV